MCFKSFFPPNALFIIHNALHTLWRHSCLNTIWSWILPVMHFPEHLIPPKWVWCVLYDNWEPEILGPLRTAQTWGCSLHFYTVGYIVGSILQWGGSWGSRNSGKVAQIMLHTHNWHSSHKSLTSSCQCHRLWDQCSGSLLGIVHSTDSRSSYPHWQTGRTLHLWCWVSR